jgi:hypothetical protein
VTVIGPKLKGQIHTAGVTGRWFLEPKEENKAIKIE